MYVCACVCVWAWVPYNKKKKLKKKRQRGEGVIGVMWGLLGCYWARGLWWSWRCRQLWWIYDRILERRWKRSSGYTQRNASRGEKNHPKHWIPINLSSPSCYSLTPPSCVCMCACVCVCVCVCVFQYVCVSVCVGKIYIYKKRGVVGENVKCGSYFNLFASPLFCHIEGLPHSLAATWIQCTKWKKK